MIIPKCHNTGVTRLAWVRTSETTMTTTTKQPLDSEPAATAIAEGLDLPLRQVRAAVELLSAGNTIPFIARYRKEATQGLDEIALRAIEDALERANALAARKTTVLKTIDEQGLLTDALRSQIENCRDLRTLEAIYLPFKPKRRTRATIARERGLQPLADLLLRQETLEQSKQDTLRAYVDAGQGRSRLRNRVAGGTRYHRRAMVRRRRRRGPGWSSKPCRYGKIASKVKRGKKEEAGKFELYVDHQEPVSQDPVASLAGHAARRIRRYLASRPATG